MKSVQLTNIPSYIEDPTYRYKMPKPFLKIEGKGNGIKTNLLNLHEIAKALKCPDQYPLKYLGFEYGSQTIYKFKNENDITCIVNGAFQDEQVRKTLDKFIEKYILCQKCKLPEMNIKLKNNKITGQCDSCGHLSDLDNTHKLASYILKNPPENAGSIAQKKQLEEKNFQVAQQQQEIVKAKKKRLTAEELTLDNDLLNQLLEELSDTYERVASDDVIQDQQLADYYITQDIKKFSLDKTLLDRLCFLIFQCMFLKHNPIDKLEKQLEKNKNLLQGLFKDADPENINIHTILNIQYLMRRHKLDDIYFATIVYRFYEQEYLDCQFIIDWFDGKEQERLQQNFLYSQEINEKYRQGCADLVENLRSSLQEWAEEDDVEQQGVQVQ